MPQNPATPATVSECEVMASVDDGDDGERLIIAELCSDEAYLAMSTDATVVVGEWR
ncbi:hypothetical protein KM295_08645 [Natronomonas sp. F2-12]|jgi:hypothetical protein|uniref:Uncharacterized protein n=1 Tax=Natronomonas aquatica TaxID=2841590 RepID=A0A9R1CT65_9EURY|nr:hypothetical protein [Natronomonas aquatica]MCQ4333542.1 hypothetical protein [Natronomonas aquatica]